MNAIRQTQKLNQRELENATPPSASWHADYRDTAWVYVGGLPLDLSEGDVVTIFSQFGSPTHLNLIRDRETGKSKGFGFLKYEDQRSCDLAVDNLTGADVLGRLLRVDHTRYKKKDDEDENTYKIDRLEAEAEGVASGRNGKRASDTEESEEERHRKKKRRPVLKEEKELEEMLAIKENGEEKDPMKDYLINEKRGELAEARKREEDREKRHRHRHRRHIDDGDREDRHRGRRTDDVEESGERHRRRRDDIDEDEERPRKQGHRSHYDRDRNQDASTARRDRTERRRHDGSDDDSRERRSHGKHRPDRRRQYDRDDFDPDGGPPVSKRPRSRSRSPEHKPSRRRRYSSEDEHDRHHRRRRSRDD